MSPEGRTKRLMKVTAILGEKGGSISHKHANNHVKIAHDQPVPNQRENDQFLSLFKAPLTGVTSSAGEGSPRSGCRRNSSVQAPHDVVLGCLSEERAGGSLISHHRPVNGHMQ